MKVSIGPYNRKRGSSPNSRTVKIKVSPYDCWNLDETLARVILPSLRCFKNRQYVGICSAYHDPNMPDEGRSLWLDAIDMMIWSFEEIIFNYHEPDFPERINYCAWKKVRDNFWENTPAVYADGALEKWKADTKAYNERIQKGLDLFGKHFRDLWI